MSSAKTGRVETRKNAVVLDGERVTKTFKRVRGGARRARRELAALTRLEGLPGVPRVLEVGADGLSFVLERLPGRPLSECAEPPASLWPSLRALGEAVLARGVARHSLPARDVIVGPDGSAGLVDFERVTLRRGPGGLVWLAFRRVARFHLLRLQGERAPASLAPEERETLQRERRVRDGFRRFLEWRRRGRRRRRGEEPRPPAGSA